MLLLCTCPHHMRSTSDLKNRNLINLQVIITLGVAIASYGEITFVLSGVLLQLAAVGTESMRLILVQILLQVCLKPKGCYWKSSALVLTVISQPGSCNMAQVFTDNCDRVALMCRVEA